MYNVIFYRLYIESILLTHFSILLLTRLLSTIKVRTLLFVVPSNTGSHTRLLALFRAGQRTLALHHKCQPRRAQKTAHKPNRKTLK